MAGISYVMNSQNAEPLNVYRLISQPTGLRGKLAAIGTFDLSMEERRASLSNTGYMRLLRTAIGSSSELDELRDATERLYRDLEQMETERRGLFLNSSGFQSRIADILR